MLAVAPSPGGKSPLWAAEVAATLPADRSCSCQRTGPDWPTGASPPAFLEQVLPRPRPLRLMGLLAGQAVCSSHRDAGSRVPSDAHSPARGMIPSLHFRISENGGRRPRLRGCSQDQVRRRTWASRPNRRTAADRAVSSRHWRPGVKPGKCRPSACGLSPGPGVCLGHGRREADIPDSPPRPPGLW